MYDAADIIFRRDYRKEHAVRTAGCKNLIKDGILLIGCNSAHMLSCMEYAMAILECSHGSVPDSTESLVQGDCRLCPAGCMQVSHEPKWAVAGYLIDIECKMLADIIE